MLIIGILAAVAVPQYQIAVAKSRYATLKNLVKSIVDAQEVYYLANGHYVNDFEQLDAAFKEARATKGVPTAIIMKTLKGKGVSFMEGQAGWHGKAPNDEQYKLAMEELKKAEEALCLK